MFANINPVLFWLVLCLILIFIETVTFNLFAVCFAAGALAAMAAAAIGLGVWWQLSLFVLGSGILLYITRPINRKLTKKETVNAEKTIGEIGVVTVDIDNVKSAGEVKIGSELWTARAIDEMSIEKGTQVVIIAISGIKLMVRRK